MAKKVLVALVMVTFIQGLLALCLVSAGQLKATTGTWPTICTTRP